jgi:hypothetical protein
MLPRSLMEDGMRFQRTMTALLCFVLGSCLAGLAAIPARGSSSNGTDTIAPYWNLFGPTAAVPRHAGTVVLRTQVVCPGQNVASAVDAAAAAAAAAAGDDTNVPFADAGSCADGTYLFIFQIQSNVKNLTVTIHRLVGFTPDVNLPTYGVLTCDSAFNTLELCSNVDAATTTAQNQLANITATVNAANTKLVFSVPNVPNFPAGSASQGQGLTLFVLTKQTPGLPLAYPKISFK